MKSFIIRICLLSQIGLMAGCLHHPLQRPARPPQAVPNGFQEDPVRPKTSPKVLVEHEVKTRDEYQVSDLELEPAKPGGRIAKLTHYAPTHLNRPAPAIVVLPIMGGQTYPLENFFAEGFAHHGFHAVVVHRPNLKEEIHDLEDIDGLLRESLSDTRRIVDWLENQPEVDPKRLGLFGISLGAIRGVMVLGMEPRLRAGVLGLPGGDLAYILTHSEDKNIKKERARILDRNSLSVKDAEEKLRESITCEPLTFAPAIDPSRVLLVIAAFDHVVPARKGWELRRKLGNPRTIQLCGGHYTSVVHVPYLRGVSARFLAEKLGDPESRHVHFEHRIPWE